MSRLLRYGSAIVLLVASCSFQDGQPQCLYDCSLCNEKGCPPDRCGLMLVMDLTCQGLVDEAESAVDNCVEDWLVSPGESTMLCAAVPFGESRTVRVRADTPEEWYWQKTVTCGADKAGDVVVLTLTCEQNE